MNNMKNRKIKVRVWSKALGRFLTKDEWFLDFDGDLYFWDIVENDLIRIPDSNYVVQQLTGLLDKKGKEIYEGDVIKHGDGSYQTPLYDKVIVEWVDENNGYDYTGWKFYDTFSQGGGFEVIGNIFENPELLEQ